LVGPNGVGKTSVLDVVFAVRQLLAGTAKVTDPGAFPTSTLTRWQKRNMQVFELDAVLEGIDYRYRLEVEHDPTIRRARVGLEVGTVGNEGIAPVPLSTGRSAALSRRSLGWTELRCGLVGVGDGSRASTK
jgi:ABC-type nitrate/sulfonate/bicarbonate transport system ATPase subunit